MNLAPFWLALQFLTRIPTPLRGDMTEAQFGRSVIAYPLVGLLIGLVLVAVAKIAQGLDRQILASMLLVVWAFITGGLHLDGLADCADAWIGGQGDRERSLAIMKDPCVGPMAVVALVLLLLLKYSALTILLRERNLAPLVWAPVAGRTAVLALMLTTPYLRPGGLGQELHTHLPRPWAGCMVGLVLLLLLWALGPWTLMGSVLVLFLLRAMMQRRLGGATGDTYGATVEILEAMVLLIPSMQIVT